MLFSFFRSYILSGRCTTVSEDPPLKPREDIPRQGTSSPFGILDSMPAARFQRMNSMTDDEKVRSVTFSSRGKDGVAGADGRDGKDRAPMENGEPQPGRTPLL